MVDAIGERFGTTGTDLNDGLAQLYGDPWEAPRFSPLSSLAYLTRLPTVLHWVLLVAAPFVSSAR